jgi:hypothetical protein
MSNNVLLIDWCLLESKIKKAWEVAAQAVRDQLGEQIDKELAKWGKPNG